jgi:hypothetical protein
MNLRTTLILLILGAGLAAAWIVVVILQPTAGTSETLAILENDLKPDRITSVEVTHGKTQVKLEKKGGAWTLPGEWQVREAQAQRLTEVLGGLRSRFDTIPLGNNPDLKRYGLDDPVVVTVGIGKAPYTLKFGVGRNPDEGNRFSRPTYVRLGDRNEVVRLAPGLVAELDRPQEYYMQHRLFPFERVARQEGSSEKVERLDAQAVAVTDRENKEIGYKLVRKADTWELSEPYRDRPDPDKLKKLLTDIPDLWVERFVDSKDKGLDEFGLKEPEQTLQVTRPGGRPLVLQVGKVSATKMKFVEKPAPPFGPPRPPMKVPVRVEYRYAKLQDNPQIFEIKGDRLKDVMVPVGELRDPRLAEFRPEDVRRVELRPPAPAKDDKAARALPTIVLVKGKDDKHWRIQEPLKVEAEDSRVEDLLRKLSGLRAEGPDVHEKGDPKDYGLDPSEGPAVVKVTVEKTAKGAAKATTEEITFRIGKEAADKKKLYVQVAGWPRVNAVADEALGGDTLAKLVRQPALAFRSRRVLSFPDDGVTRVKVERGGEEFTLAKDKDTWRLTAPEPADVDADKARRLAGELARLDAAEFIPEPPSATDLDKLYGLGNSALLLTATAADAKAAPRTLRIGKEREGKKEFYARLDSDPAVFTLRKDTVDILNQGALAYLPLKLWDMKPEQVATINVHGAGPDYRLKREGEAWKVSGPFTAPADPAQVRPLVDALAEPHAVRYVALKEEKPGQYGFDKGKLRVSVRPPEPTEKDKTAAEKNKEQEHLLVIGGRVGKDSNERYARRGDSGPVFVVGPQVVTAVDHPALDLLDRQLLSLQPRHIQSLHTTGSPGTLTLTREKDGWRVTEAPVAPFPADERVVADSLALWSPLRAERLADYGDKVDPTRYGLDKLATTVTIISEAPTSKEKKEKHEDKNKKADRDKKIPLMAVHILVLGKLVEGGKGERYARVSGSAAVAVLDARTVEVLSRGYLDYVNRTALELEADKVTAVTRLAGKDMLEVVKDKDGWRLAKPADRAADTETVTGLVWNLSHLRAERVAAYPAKDLAPFGLATPAAVVTLRLGDAKGKPAEHKILLGGPVPAKDKKDAGSRYARVDGSNAVLVLPAGLTDQLLAAPLQFLDRNLVKVPMPTQAVLDRGTRKATFTEEDGDWKLTAPVAASADSANLQAFVKNVSQLRVDRLVEEKPADLKRYGLHQPRAVWHFAAGGKEVLTLLVGAPAKGGGRGKVTEPGKAGEVRQFTEELAYAKLAGSDLIFVLGEQLTGQALAEYRDRKVWPRPDAAQVEGLHYKYAKESFVLQKLGNTWNVLGKADPVNQSAVTETLDALARVEALRYVSDNGMGRQLYGLEPPTLTLEVEMPDGKRTLLLGRQEGNSGSYYAQVAGAADAPIFVLAEGEARKILRPLKRFTTAAK